MSAFDVSAASLPQGASFAGTSLFIPGDQHSVATLLFKDKRGAAVAGKKFSISTSCPLLVNPIDGVLDANGQASITIGPSFGLKGDASMTFKVDQSTTINIRFTQP